MFRPKIIRLTYICSCHGEYIASTRVGQTRPTLSVLKRLIGDENFFTRLLDRFTSPEFFGPNLCAWHRTG